MVNRKGDATSTKEMVSNVGIGAGQYTCDASEHEHFETTSVAKFNEHKADHKVIAGGAYCTECNERVIFGELDDKDKPTLNQVKNNLVFHPKCAVKFFKDKGFEVKQLK